MNRQKVNQVDLEISPPRTVEVKQKVTHQKSKMFMTDHERALYFERLQ